MLRINKTEVFNLALGMLGQTYLTTNADADNSTQVRVLRNHFRMALYKLLELHPWRIYQTRQPLALIDRSPTLDWEFAYAVPEDCAVINSISPNDYFPEGPYVKQLPFDNMRLGHSVIVVCNVPNAWAKYTAVPDEAEAFPMFFGEALAAMMAKVSAPSIITNNYFKVKEGFMFDVNNTLSNSIAIDLQKQPDTSKDYSPTTAARLQYDY